jgi:hypothetical protein
MEDVNIQGNQTEVMDIDELDYFLPDDYVEEESTDQTESEEEQVEGEESEKTIEEEEPKTKLSDLLGVTEIKAGRETHNIDDISDLKAVIEKGLGYDWKVNKQSEKLESAMLEANEFKDVAEMYNMDTEQLKTALRDKYFQDIATRDKRNVNDVRKEYMDGRKDLQTQRIEQFLQKYPDVKADSLPESVLEASKLGANLIDAYEMHQLNEKLSEKDTTIAELTAKVEELEKASKTKKQNDKVKQKGVVKSVSGSDDAAKDDFLAGLLGE